MKTSRALISVAAVGSVLLIASACSSGGSSSSASSGSAVPKATKAPLTLLFGSSGPAETKAVDAAAAAFTRQSGIKVKVIAASNLTQQLSQGFAAGKPPDVFYLDPGTFQNYAKDNALYPYAQTLPNARRFLPRAAGRLHLQGHVRLRPEGREHPRPVHQYRRLARGRPDQRGHPEELEPARRGGEEAHHRRPGRPGARPESLRTRRVPLPERRHGRRVERQGRAGQLAQCLRAGLPEEDAGPGRLEVPASAVLGLERTGLRREQGRHGHRRQLAGRCDAGRLPEGPLPGRGDPCRSHWHERDAIFHQLLGRYRGPRPTSAARSSSCSS